MVFVYRATGGLPNRRQQCPVVLNSAQFCGQLYAVVIQEPKNMRPGRRSPDSKITKSSFIMNGLKTNAF